MSPNHINYIRFGDIDAPKPYKSTGSGISAWRGQALVSGNVQGRILDTFRGPSALCALPIADKPEARPKTPKSAWNRLEILGIMGSEALEGPRWASRTGPGPEIID